MAGRAPPLLLLLPLLLSGVVMATAQSACPEGAPAGEAACRAHPQGAVCSGRGDCVCGECACDQRPNPSESVYGRFCECDNFSCDRHLGRLCGGPDRGRCECGQCQCQPGWQGDGCDCTTTNSTCMAPGSDKVCSGQGICECGQCRCFQGLEGGYSGKYCGECPTCSNRCSDFRSCVECRVFKAGAFRANCTSSCAHLTISQTELPHKNMRQDELLCSFFLNDARSPCRYKFFYSSGDHVVRVPPSQACLSGREGGSPGGGGGAAQHAALLGPALLVGTVALIEWLTS